MARNARKPGDIAGCYYCAMTTGRLPGNASALFLSHGGGPLPLLGDPAHEEMIEGLRSIAAAIERPEAIIVISAHWEQTVATITGAGKPDIIYDYYGFPPESYEIRYPAPGHPGLAGRLRACLQHDGIAAAIDPVRGFDHGVFVPLKIMYPEADIPCVQLSLLASLDPAAHIALGAAMSEMRRDDILVIGSGFSFHNLRAFFRPDASQPDEKNDAFERWLIDTCSSPELDEIARTRRLLHWEEAPHARYCHPREEHLLPLHVCYGMEKRAAEAVVEMRILNKKASLYVW